VGLLLSTFQATVHYYVPRLWAITGKGQGRSQAPVARVIVPRLITAVNTIRTLAWGYIDEQLELHVCTVHTRMDRPTRGRMTCPTRLPDPPVGTLVTPPTSTPRIPAPPGTSPPITSLAQSRWFASFFSVAGGLVFEDSFGVLLHEGDDLSLLDRSSVRIAARSIQRFEVTS
jgi:hypothetical protein